jgi:hypothetical protein
LDKGKRVNKRLISRTIGLIILLGVTSIARFGFRYRDIKLDPCLYTEVDALTAHTDEASDIVWLNIFVHGIMSIKPHLSVHNFMNFMNDDVENTVYSKTVELMRNDPHFYHNQAMQGHGLQEIFLDRIEPGYASGAIANLHEKIYQELTSRKSTENRYYTYGWSGLLSDKSRKRESVEAYLSILNEVRRVQAMGKTPRVRLISYSHGGNFCLNIAHGKPEDKELATLVIDELILMGVPIQKETDYLVNDPFFKRIYNIYSRGDRIQKLDFFSFDRFFSNRIFKDRDGLKIPKNKVIQIQLRLTRNSQFRKDTKLHPSRFDLDNPAILSGKHKIFRDSSPGHAELWFFGWTPQNYRDQFALMPLPAVAVLPLILDAVHQFEDHELYSTPTIVDIRPEHEIIIVKNQKSERSVVVGEFIPLDKLEELKKFSLQFRPPDPYTTVEYTNHIQESLDLARRLQREENAVMETVKVEKRRDK